MGNKKVGADGITPNTYKTFTAYHKNLLAKAERELVKELVQAREEQELTYVAVSQLGGISPNSVSRCEHNGIKRMSVMHIVLWADALGYELTLTKK